MGLIKINRANLVINQKKGKKEKTKKKIK